MCEHFPMANPIRQIRSDRLSARLAALGREIGAREAEHADALAAARVCAERLHFAVAAALADFHAAAAAAGAPHLRIEQSALGVDAKHLRAVEFDLLRGRYKAVVTVKSRGQVTLVGPFHLGKEEGPCRSFSSEAGEELDQALAAFVERFLEEACTP
jgi:hypothetical protein